MNIAKLALTFVSSAFAINVEILIIAPLVVLPGSAHDPSLTPCGVEYCHNFKDERSMTGRQGLFAAILPLTAGLHSSLRRSIESAP
nr:hypothetical protein CFP56_00476 [Quercus suber]